MRKKRWTVGIDWIDGAVEDTSEVVVFAESAAEAKAAAAKQWRLTNGAWSSSCRVQRLFILTDAAILRDCY